MEKRAELILSVMILAVAVPVWVFVWGYNSNKPVPAQNGVNVGVWETSIAARGKTDPDSRLTYRAHFNLGSAYLRNGKIVEAAVCLRHCIDNAPKNSPEWLNSVAMMGVLSERMGTWDKASKMWSLFARYHPGFATIRTEVNGCWRQLRLRAEQQEKSDA